MMVTYIDTAVLCDDAMLDGYDARERDAILEHKYYLGIELGFDPGMVAALESWNDRYAGQWRKMRMQFDCQSQIEQIRLYHAGLCSSGGLHPSMEEAAQEWIAKYAGQWRAAHCS